MEPRPQPSGTTRAAVLPYATTQRGGDEVQFARCLAAAEKSASRGGGRWRVGVVHAYPEYGALLRAAKSSAPEWVSTRSKIISDERARHRHTREMASEQRRILGMRFDYLSTSAPTRVPGVSTRSPGERRERRLDVRRIHKAKRVLRTPADGRVRGAGRPVAPMRWSSSSTAAHEIGRSAADSGAAHGPQANSIRSSRLEYYCGDFRACLDNDQRFGWSGFEAGEGSRSAASGGRGSRIHRSSASVASHRSTRRISLGPDVTVTLRTASHNHGRATRRRSRRVSSGSLGRSKDALRTRARFLMSRNRPSARARCSASAARCTTPRTRS